MAPTPVRQKAFAAKSAFTHSGEGKGLATAPIAATSHRVEIATLKPRSSATRNGCTQRIGTKVKTTKTATMASETKGGGMKAKRKRQTTFQMAGKPTK